MLIRVSGHKHNGAIIWLDVDRHDTVRKLKLMVQDRPEMRRIPTYYQRLKHGRYYGNIVGVVRPTESFPADDQLSLAHYGIADGSKLLSEQIAQLPQEIISHYYCRRQYSHIPKVCSHYIGLCAMSKVLSQ